MYIKKINLATWRTPCLRVGPLDNALFILALILYFGSDSLNAV